MAWGFSRTVQYLLQDIQQDCPPGSCPEEEAFKPLVELGDLAVPELSDALDSDDTKTAWLSACALGLIAEKHGGAVVQDALPALRAALKHPDPQLRMITTFPLEQLGAAGTDTISDLTNVVENDSSPGVRAAAAITLGQIGGRPEVAVPALTRALGDPNERVRSAAAFALEKLGERAREAVPLLIQALEDPDIRARWAAMKVLGAIGRAARPAVPPLIEALRNGEPEAAYALAKIAGDDRQVIDAMIEALRNPAMRNVIGSFGEPAIPALLSLAEDKSEDASVRIAAVEFIWVMGDKARNAVSALKKLSATAEDSGLTQTAEDAWRGIVAELRNPETGEERRP
jgi:hypothetical protein